MPADDDAVAFFQVVTPPWFVHYAANLMAGECADIECPGTRRLSQDGR